MADHNEVFLFTKGLFNQLPLEEGQMSIYGVRPDDMFGPNAQGRIFRDTESSVAQGKKGQPPSNSTGYSIQREMSMSDS